MPKTAPVVHRRSDSLGWHKNRKSLRDGFSDLVYLPSPPDVWDATLAAYAYAVRQKVASKVNLNTWALMNGLLLSGRFEKLGESAVVLWHGTAAYKALKILEEGFRPVNRGAVYASMNPDISHGYTRFRSMEREGGSAMFALVISKRAMEEEFHFSQGAKEIRLHSKVPPDYVEYVLWSDRIDFVGKERARSASPWARFKFKKKDGEWIPLTNPPVRFDSQHEFSSKEEWLELSIGRILRTLGTATAIEIFSSLYSTIEPWRALGHDEIFRAMEKHCTQSEQRAGLRLFCAS